MGPDNLQASKPCEPWEKLEVYEIVKMFPR